MSKGFDSIMEGLEEAKTFQEKRNELIEVIRDASEQSLDKVRYEAIADHIIAKGLFRWGKTTRVISEEDQQWLDKRGYVKSSDKFTPVNPS